MVDDAVSGFEAVGATVERVDLDPAFTHDDVLDAYYTFATVLWESLFDALEEEDELDPRGADRDRLAESTVETVLDADGVTTREYKAADRTRTRVLEFVEGILAGLIDEGLPVGMQLVGPRLADDEVLAASAAFERVRPWRNDYPY